jgi:elongation factor G
MHRLRTFGIVAHIDAGKTTLTERILHDSGAQSFAGSVEDGTATCDWLPQEKSRGISITAAVTRVAWAGAELQVVDTPGHVDFTAEVERCLFVLDAVVVVVDAVRGVESQTEVVWQQADARQLPRLVFLNKMDRAGADYAARMAELQSVFGCRAIPYVIALVDDRGAFAGLGHALTGAVQWFAGRPEPAEAQRILRELRAAREDLLEALADADEAVFAAMVEGRSLPAGELQRRLVVAVHQRRLVPVLAGAALLDRGVDWLLDAVVQLVPTIHELPAVGLWGGEAAGQPEAHFAGIVFKVQHADTVWNFLRVVRGTLRPGAELQVCGRSLPGFTPTEIWVMQADRHRCVALALPGEIVVIPGELGLRTGDTLAAKGYPIQLPVPTFPAPVVAANFEPERAADAPLLLAGLRQLAADDPTLKVHWERGQIVVHGMGELHLEIVAEGLRGRVAVPFRRSRLRVERRQSIQRRGEAESEVRATVAGVERSAAVQVMVEPLGDGSQPGQVVTGEHLPGSAAAAAQAALQECLATNAQGRLVGVAVHLLAVRLDRGGLVEGLVQLAAVRALEGALAEAGLQIQEPWVALEVWCPEASCNAVLADLGGRGAAIHGVASGQLGARIRGTAPLSRMLGYVTRLRSISRGLGRVVLRPSGFAAVPAGEAE